MSDFLDELRDKLAADERDAKRLVEHIGEGWLQAVEGALAILELHKPQDEDRSYTECVTCHGSYASWPCPTLVALGHAHGIEYLSPPVPEPVEVDLDALRAALDPDDKVAQALLDFDAHPEGSVVGPFGIRMTREQRIEAAAARPAMRKMLEETEAVYRELEPSFLGEAFGGKP